MRHTVGELPVLDDRWILQQRGPRQPVDPARPYALVVEPERTADGVVEDVAAVFLTNRECPFRCLMCDLWKNTTTSTVPDGAVAGQIAWALSELPPVRHIKLYNAGNFFDGRAIPRADWAPTAELLRDMQTVIVECHPRLVGPGCLEFAGMIPGRLDVAMGLETVDPDVLPRLSKRMTLEDFAQAARFLVDHGMRVRAFILLRAPFQSEEQGCDWAQRSIEWAFDAGVECCVVIPTRGGNGAMERLAELGHFAPPSLDSLEEVLAFGIGLGRGRVLADLWDAQRLAARSAADEERVERLRRMNLTQQAVPPPADRRYPAGAP